MVWLEPTSSFMMFIAGDFINKRIAQADLEEIGISTKYIEIKVPLSIEDDHAWDGIKRRYFSLNSYRLPICKLLN